jgi:hypothetical protein
LIVDTHVIVSPPNLYLVFSLHQKKPPPQHHTKQQTETATDEIVNGRQSNFYSEEKEELLTFVYVPCLWHLLVIPDVLAPGQQHLDSGLLKGKIRVGKVNLPVVQIFFSIR